MKLLGRKRAVAAEGERQSSADALGRVADCDDLAVAVGDVVALPKPILDRFDHLLALEAVSVLVSRREQVGDLPLLAGRLREG